MAVAYITTGSEMTNSTAQPYSTDSGLPWFALQVRSQRENYVADQLSAKGYELFLPLYSSRKRWSDRIKKVELPLFPGYLFCRFDPYNRLPILKTPWILQIVGFNHIPSPVDNEEISAVRTLVATGACAQPWPFIGVGEKVRIESGPLRGVVGVLTQVKGDHKLVVSITLLQRSVAVEIDSALVTPERSVQENRVNDLIPVSAYSG
jgi:transcription antitermination factor NusG